MAKRYTKDEIEILSKNPNVKHVRENRLTLTFEFRQKLYAEWIKNPSIVTIRNFLIACGFNTGILGSSFIRHLNSTFKTYGSPSRGTNKEFGTNALNFRANEKDSAYLLSTGVFVNYRNGISFSKEFIEEVAFTYPDISIEDKLKEKGIDIEIVGYRRIYFLKRRLNDDYKLTEKSCFTKEFKAKYTGHPYVYEITNKQFVINDSFFRDSKLFETLNINDILKIFKFDPNDFSYSYKTRLMGKIRNGEIYSNEFIYDADIISNRIKKLEELISSNNEVLKLKIKSSSKLSKKSVVSLINETFNSKDKINIANNLGISKSSFYSILKNDNYGLFEEEKNNNYIEEFKHIKKVLDSDPYPMGKRMVYMKMDAICGFHYSIKKISKLMKMNDSTCKLRLSKESVKELKELQKRNTKPNILNRRFKMARPNQIKLTDVTYLKYGDNKTAYKSTIKDAVTGKIDVCVISDHNDLKLAEDTLNHLDNTSFISGALFHSDQGVLYMTDLFQTKLKELGFVQSMSKRGNSQDNASQESYFGHFKDECDYQDCSTLDEVIAKVNHYIDYYNNRRPQWSRNKMTPVEYEKYLSSLDDKDYDLYLKIEEEKYLKMKQRAKVLAIERNKTLGVEEYVGTYTIRKGNN